MSLLWIKASTPGLQSLKRLMADFYLMGKGNTEVKVVKLLRVEVVDGQKADHPL
jgi:hypothetical protein